MTHAEVIVSPTELRDFAKARGWVLVPEAMADGLCVLNHPRFRPRQLSFPMDTTAPDYADAVRSTLNRLAEMEAMPYDRIVARVVAFRDDTLRFRVLLEQDEAGLPLPFAAQMVTGAKDLLRAAACTLMKPQRHHPRLSRTEAQQIASAARFRHTQPGSFVLPISCPVDALDARPALLPGETDAPFVRRATRMLERALATLVRGIESDDLEGIVDGGRSTPPIVSSNLCEALLQFHDPELRNSLEFEIDWAQSRPEPEGERRRVRIQRDYFPRVEEVRRELRTVEGDKHDTFVGTVEHLAGEMGDDGRRAGEVVLALLLPESEIIVRARIQLDADDYARADRAHMMAGVYVKVMGRLQPGRQPRSLTDVKSFDVLWPLGHDEAGRPPA